MAGSTIECIISPNKKLIKIFKPSIATYQVLDLSTETINSAMTTAFTDSSRSFFHYDSSAIYGLSRGGIITKNYVRLTSSPFTQTTANTPIGTVTPSYQSYFSSLTNQYIYLGYFPTDRTYLLIIYMNASYNSGTVLGYQLPANITAISIPR